MLPIRNQLIGLIHTTRGVSVRVHAPCISVFYLDSYQLVLLMKQRQPIQKTEAVMHNECISRSSERGTIEIKVIDLYDPYRYARH